MSPLEWSKAGKVISTHPDWNSAVSELKRDLALLVREGPRTYSAALRNLKELIVDKETEDRFHECIGQFPKLLIPGVINCYSKPQLRYPSGKKSPNGKSFVEPDFIFCVGHEMYEIVEIERSNKRTQRSNGQNRAEVTQANFQLTEFEHLIENHPDQVREQFPGIPNATNRQKVLVIGEDNSKNPEVMRGQFPAVRVETWTEIVSRAEKIVPTIKDDPWASAGADN